MDEIGYVDTAVGTRVHGVHTRDIRIPPALAAEAHMLGEERGIPHGDIAARIVVAA